MDKPKILIVDDDPDLRRGLNLRLRASHFETAYAADGFSAIAMAQKERPDLIILDIGLPAGDGFVVLDRLQQSATLASIPVIVLTARDPQYNRERTLKAGACAFLQKPADNNELMDVIRTTLNPVCQARRPQLCPVTRQEILAAAQKYPPDSCLAGTVCGRAVSTLLSSSALPWPNVPSGRPQSSGAPPPRAASASAWYKNVRYSAYPGPKERHQRVLVDRADSFVPLSVARLQTPTPSDLP